MNPRTAGRVGSALGVLLALVVLAAALWIARSALVAILVATAGLLFAAVGFVMAVGARGSHRHSRRRAGWAAVVVGLALGVGGLAVFVADRVDEDPAPRAPTGAVREPGYGASSVGAAPAAGRRLAS